MFDLDSVKKNGQFKSIVTGVICCFVGLTRLALQCGALLATNFGISFYCSTLYEILPIPINNFISLCNKKKKGKELDIFLELCLCVLSQNVHIVQENSRINHLIRPFIKSC